MFLANEAHSTPAVIHQGENAAWRYNAPMFGGDSEGFCAPTAPVHEPNPLAALDQTADDSEAAGCEINPGQLVDDVDSGRRLLDRASEQLLVSSPVKNVGKVRSVTIDSCFNFTSDALEQITVDYDESLWWFLTVLKWGQLIMGLACLVTLFAGISWKFASKLRRNNENDVY